METVRKHRRRTIVIALTGAAAAVGLIGGVAIAMLGGAISGVNLATGVASSQAQPCQTAPVNFEFVQPEWNGSAREFNIAEVSYRDLSAACVGAGATLHVVVTEGNTTFLDTTLVPADTSGTLELSTPLNSNRAPDAEINYLVAG